MYLCYLNSNRYINKALDTVTILGLFSNSKEDAKRGIQEKDWQHEKITAVLIKEFKQKTNLSIRGVAAITRLNKDKINKMLRES
jgi:hypothetical protein